MALSVTLYLCMALDYYRSQVPKLFPKLNVKVGQKQQRAPRWDSTLKPPRQGQGLSTPALSTELMDAPKIFFNLSDLNFLKLLLHLFPLLDHLGSPVIDT